MTHFSQQDNFSVAARVLGALFYYAPESAEAAPLVAVLTSDGWETQWLDWPPESPDNQYHLNK